MAYPRCPSRDTASHTARCSQHRNRPVWFSAPARTQAGKGQRRVRGLYQHSRSLSRLSRFSEQQVCRALGRKFVHTTSETQDRNGLASVPMQLLATRCSRSWEPTLPTRSFHSAKRTSGAPRYPRSINRKAPHGVLMRTLPGNCTSRATVSGFCHSSVAYASSRRLNPNCGRE